MTAKESNLELGAGGRNLINMEGVQAQLRDYFIGWQCRLRQHSIRNNNGEPSPGMTPDVALDKDGAGYGQIKVLLLRQDPSEYTPEMRQMVRKTRDPKMRYDNALKYFAENYYADKQLFSDRMTALFGAGSQAALRVINACHITLVFYEKNQQYVIPSKVRCLEKGDDAWQATYWHNHLFNPVLPGDCIVLQFTPDWTSAHAEPKIY